MTQDWWSRQVVLACAAAVILASGVAAQDVGPVRGAPRLEQTAQQLAERAVASTWDTLTMRVVIRRQLLGGDGQPVGPRVVGDAVVSDARQEFIWQRTKTSTGWKTTMTLVQAAPRTVRSLKGDVRLPESPTVSRIEDDEDGTAPRLFNREGARLVGPTDAMRARFAMSAAGLTERAAPGMVVESPAQGGAAIRPAQGREWVRALIMSPIDRAGRLRSMEQTFGKRVGLVRGLGRYVRDAVDPERGATIHEVLVDEQIGAPIETNVVQGGALVAHSLFAYERAVTGAVVRRGVRIERALSGSSSPEEAALGRVLGGTGLRVVSEVSYSDIQLEQKGGR